MEYTVCTPYVKSWEHQLENRRSGENSIVIFDLEWISPTHLVGVSNQGDLYIWNVPQVPNEEEDIGENDMGLNIEPSSRSPLWKEKVSKGILYSVTSVQQGPTTNNRKLIAVGGDEGVILMEIDLSNTIIGVKRKASYATHPNPAESSIEINDVVSSLEQGHLFGAAGDAFGCYKWDIETQKVMATYPSQHRQYLHCLEVMDPAHILTGGDDGSLSIYDVKQDKLVDQIDLGGWISSIASFGESWWAVGAGNHGSGGWIASFHAPTRSTVAEINTRERPLALQVLADATLLSVGNDASMHCQNIFSLERTKRHETCAKAGYAIAVSDNLVATAGVGSVVELFYQSEPYYRLNV